MTLTTWSGGTGATYYYHENAHGDVIRLTDSSGNTVAQYTYDPWGNVTSESGSLDTTNPYLYAGYRWDSAIGMYYLNARYYAPNLMRFISADPSGGMNAYAYCDDNPVTKVDPSGDWSLWKTIATVAAVAVAVGLAATGVGLIADVAGLSLMEEAAAAEADASVMEDTEATVARRSRLTYRPRPRATHHSRPRYTLNLHRFSSKSRHEVTPASNERLAHNLGNKYGGTVKPNKGGHTVTIPNRKQTIVVRVQSVGGKNPETGEFYTNYWRMSVGNKAIDGSGKFSNGLNPLDTHIAIGPETEGLISRFIDRYLQ